ncbi:hypothetical protein CLV42_10426 [Chitinophaga ginsengisoli]|uniref:Uncharacterized protein n=1 Tax=Chitinophaga ginsengisoli TaxID=363837 RepID=A0A2P8GCN1_9BACT|nr:hypothetical protein CLV42_10426 [Chitinophaga ginsengisoli]
MIFSCKRKHAPIMRIAAITVYPLLRQTYLTITPFAQALVLQYEDWLKKGWLRKIGCVHLSFTSLVPSIVDVPLCIVQISNINNIILMT